MHSLLPQHMRLLRLVFVTLCAFACLRALWFVALAISYFLQADSFVQDADLYLAVSRGMLNGLSPYKDLFEIKPPGIFLMGALSLLLFGNAWLGNLLGALTLLAIATAVPLFGWHMGRTLDNEGRLTLTFLGVLTGAFWVLFAAEKGQPWQTEVFGSLFALLYVLTLFWQSAPTKLRTVVATLGLLGCIGIKEPFVFSCAAAAVLAARKPKDLLRSFALPLLYAIILGVVVAAVLGILSPYVLWYLPALTYRGYAFDPLWLRGLNVWKTVQNLSHITWLAPPAVAGLLAVRVAGISPVRGRVMAAGAMLGALYLALVAVGSAGDYQAHHFVFLTPLFLAAVFVAARTGAAGWQERRVRAGIITLTVVWAAVALTARRPVLAALVPAQQIQEAKAVAAGIDTVLDRCSVDRYLIILKDALHPWMYTRHSPLNHALFHQIDNGVQYGQRFLEESILRLEQAKVIVFPHETFMANNPIGDEMGPYIQRTFSMTAPACAGALPELPGYGFLFRVSDEKFTKKFEFAIPPKP